MEIDSYNVICPYCESICCDGNGFFEYSDYDETKEYKCDDCGKKFYVERVITTDYRTQKDCKLNAEECEAGEYHCKNCDSYDVNIKQKQEMIE